MTNQNARLTLLTLLLTTLTHAQQPTTLLVDIDHRQTTTLNGRWHYLVDEPGFALYNAGNGKVNDNTYALNQHPNITGPDKGPEYDFSHAPTLNVPGDWNTQDPTLFRYEGIVWYQRDFNFTPAANTRTFLHIGAANYRSYIWVNGRRLCDHEGGFTPFDCDATALLHAGSNFVVIAVDAKRIPDAIPSPDVDWFNYGGLTREVSLLTVPTTFIDDYDIHLAPNMADITGYAHIEGATPGTQVTLTFPELHLTTKSLTDATGRATFDLHAPILTLWSPENPKLYKLQLTAAAASGTPDTLTDDIGLRTIRIDGTRILLNDKPIFLRGICIQGEAPIRTGRISTDADVATLFTYVQDLHANFIRLAHYPYDERITRTADRLGILVWSEIPLWQRIAFTTPGVYEKADNMLHEMIRRDRNKASVIFWSVANETPDNPARTAFLKNLIADARTLDPTRPITAALNSERIDTATNTVTLTDPLADAVDVIAINEYIGWYTGLPTLADKITWSLPQKPLIMSEFGAEATPGNHGNPALAVPASAQRWTEESQADLFRHQFTMLAKIPQLRGTTPWLLMDFRSPGRNIPILQDGFNRKGLISEQGKKKQAFYILRDQYQTLTIGKPE